MVVLRGVNIIENYAKIGGGGLIVSHPENVALDCSNNRTEYKTSARISDGFLEMKETRKMRRLSNASCPSWVKNEIDANGYGPLKASFADSAKACLEGDQCRSSVEEIPVHRSSEFIPSIQIILIDRFGQVNADPNPDHSDLLVEVSSPQTRLSGQLNSKFERGKAILNETIVTGHPGSYQLHFSFTDKRIEPLVLNSALQQCEIGEESVLNDTACQRCESGTYNIEQPLGTCKDCPEGCVCRKWGIYPTEEYWTPSPCIAKAQECISENACNKGKPLYIKIKAFALLL